MDLVPPLLHHLPPPLKVEVVEHFSEPPSPWAGYKRCITDLPDCTHLLVLQDDAQPVPGFADVLPKIACDVPVCLWMSAIPGSAAARARRARGRYISLGPANIVPLVAVLWPKPVVAKFAEWAEQNPARLTIADDGNVARWMRQARQEFRVCVPSIVEHNDFTPTVKGGTRRESRGLASDRVALLLADDARNFGW